MSLFQCTGYKPFVEACIDAGQKNEAVKYIPKLTDPRERSEVCFNLLVIYKSIQTPPSPYHVSLDLGWQTLLLREGGITSRDKSNVSRKA